MAMSDVFIKTCQLYLAEVQNFSILKVIAPHLLAQLPKFENQLQSTQRRGGKNLKNRSELIQLDQWFRGNLPARTPEVKIIASHLRNLRPWPATSIENAAQTVFLAFWFVKSRQNLMRGKTSARLLLGAMADKLGIHSQHLPAMDRKVTHTLSNNQLPSGSLEPPLDWPLLAKYAKSLDQTTPLGLQASVLLLAKWLNEAKTTTYAAFFLHVTKPVKYLIKHQEIVILRAFDQAACLADLQGYPPWHLPEWCTYCPSFLKKLKITQINMNGRSDQQIREELQQIFRGHFPWSALSDFLAKHRPTWLPSTVPLLLKRFENASITMDELSNLCAIFNSNRRFFRI